MRTLTPPTHRSSDDTRALLRLDLSDGEVPCPKKGVLAMARCLQQQEAEACTCDVYRARAGLPLVGAPPAPHAPPPGRLNVVAQRAREQLLDRLAGTLLREPERTFSHAELSATAGRRVFLTPDVLADLVQTQRADRVEGGYRAHALRRSHLLAEMGAEAPADAPEPLATAAPATATVPVEEAAPLLGATDEPTAAPATTATTATTPAPKEPAMTPPPVIGGTAAVRAAMSAEPTRRFTIAELLPVYGGKEASLATTLNKMIRRGEVRGDKAGHFYLEEAEEAPKAPPAPAGAAPADDQPDTAPTLVVLEQMRAIGGGDLQVDIDRFNRMDVPRPAVKAQFTSVADFFHAPSMLTPEDLEKIGAAVPTSAVPTPVMTAPADAVRLTEEPPTRKRVAEAIMAAEPVTRRDASGEWLKPAPTERPSVGSYALYSPPSLFPPGSLEERESKTLRLLLWMADGVDHGLVEPGEFAGRMINAAHDLRLARERLAPR